MSYDMSNYSEHILKIYEACDQWKMIFCHPRLGSSGKRHATTVAPNACIIGSYTFSISLY